MNLYSEECWEVKYDIYIYVMSLPRGRHGRDIQNSEADMYRVPCVHLLSSELVPPFPVRAFVFFIVRSVRILRANKGKMTFEHRLHYSFRHVWSMYGSSPFRSTLNTGCITAWNMCEVCTEAVHSVALWTRVTLQLWTCVKYVLVQAVHSVALWTRVTLQLWTCVKYVPKQSIP